MADGLSKLIRFLDQLLPFLQACPQPLRIWVFVLIGVNFLTVAGVIVSYLWAKETAVEAGSIARFSIYRPTVNQEIPLDETQDWMATGQFPVVQENASQPDARVTVEVLRLPERNKIEQPISDARLDTAKGQWRFEHMKFDGPGSYEIVATAYFNHRSSFIPISVKCVQKISAYKLSVARERGLRGAPDKFVPLSSDMTHDGVMMQLASLQDQFIAAYLKSNDLGRSLEAVNRAFDLLDPAIEAFPSDPDIQALRAFFLKNYAMVERDLGEPQKFQAALDEATLMFEALTVQRPEDWNGWNGMGSVFILRNEPEKALLYIDKSLELQPGNQFAQQDRDAAIQLLNRKAGEAHSSAAASK